MVQVSIVIINYNTQQLTNACIASIYKHTKGVKVEVILVDNASTECNAQVFKDAFPDIILLAEKTNHGFAGGNNIGISVARAPYVLLLNSDTELANDAITIAYQFMEVRPDIGVVSSQLLYPDGRLQYPANRFPDIGVVWLQIIRAMRFFSAAKRTDMFLGDSFDHLSSRECDWVWGAFFMFPTAALQVSFGAKALPADLFMYAEDMQWCYGFKAAGYKVYYLATAKVVHHIGGSGKVIEDVVGRELKVIVPNQYKVIGEARGKLFARWLFFSRALGLFTLRQAHASRQAKAYLKMILS